MDPTTTGHVGTTCSRAIRSETLALDMLAATPSSFPGPFCVLASAVAANAVTQIELLPHDVPQRLYSALKVSRVTLWCGLLLHDWTRDWGRHSALRDLENPKVRYSC